MAMPWEDEGSHGPNSPARPDLHLAFGNHGVMSAGRKRGAERSARPLIPPPASRSAPSFSHKGRRVSREPLVQLLRRGFFGG